MFLSASKISVFQSFDLSVFLVGFGRSFQLYWSSPMRLGSGHLDGSKEEDGNASEEGHDAVAISNIIGSIGLLTSDSNHY